MTLDGWARMHSSQANILAVDTPVWIWFVRLGKGAWWPGRVERITFGESADITVRFECRSKGGQKYPHVFIGLTTTKARYVELRAIEAGEADRPRSAPIPLLRQPEVAHLI